MHINLYPDVRAYFTIYKQQMCLSLSDFAYYHLAPQQALPLSYKSRPNHLLRSSHHDGVLFSLPYLIFRNVQSDCENDERTRVTKIMGHP